MHQGIVEKIVFGGNGLLKEADGRVVWIPFSIDGEAISYEITEKKSSYARGKLLEVYTPSDHRTTARCPHYQLCCGCQLQHIDYAHQLTLKTAWLKELLRRIAGLEIDVPKILPQTPWEYRRSVEWVWKQEQLGYSGPLGQFVPIEVCFLLKDSRQAIEKTKNLLKKLNLQEARVRWLQSDHLGARPLLSIDTDEKPSPSTIHGAWKLEKQHFRGWIFHQKKRPFLVLGAPFIDEEVLGLNIRWHGLSFIQNHAEGSSAFYRWIEERLAKTLDERRPLDPLKRLVLADLYCGSGITSLLAARMGFEVHGFELSAHALAGAKENAKANHLEDRTHFHRTNLETIGHSQALFQTDQPPSYWIANPARAGLSNGLCKLIAEHAQLLFYLSCDPATLARDLKKLTQAGLRVEALQSFDCFAQTSHFETAVQLVRIQ